MVIKVGDVLSVPFGLFSKHYGVCVGHTTRGQPILFDTSLERGHADYVGFTDFARGRTVTLEFRPQWVKAIDLQRRARERRHKAYWPLTYNCEHTAYYVATGTPQSGQAGNVLVGLLVLTVIGVGSAAVTLARE